MNAKVPVTGLLCSEHHLSVFFILVCYGSITRVLVVCVLVRVDGNRYEAVRHLVSQPRSHILFPPSLER